ncbi:MAG: AAA family ATPase [Spirochaetaceae bacterium]|jgi:uncharacterized protein YPO0396|nr:AAA family ATPase [Spirochaetaceae bacterium]
MKLLKKMLLIHWHYFTHEMIEFDMINFLTGKNASGKSTIIDALQLVILADTSGNPFNKAASGKSNRTLKGYLLGELGDNEGSGFKYLRNGRFTSYIALEFFDDEKAAFFTAGCCFDVYSEDDHPRLFFRFNGAMPEHHFIDTALDGRKPMDIASLRSWIRENYAAGSFFTTDTNISFQEDLYGKLGALQARRFSQLLKRAVSFDPNVDIQKFISEFICDTPQIVDVSSLQENIRSYTRLEAEEVMLRERIECLDRIITAYGSFDAHRNNEILYSYLIEKAGADIKQAAIEDNNAQAETLRQSIKKLRSAIDEGKKRLDETQRERDELRVQLMSNETARVVEHLENQIRDKEEEIDRIRREFEAVSRHFSELAAQWRSKAGFFMNENKRISLEVFDQILAPRIENIRGEAELFTRMLDNFYPADAQKIKNSGESEIKSRIQAADGLKTSSKSLAERLLEEETELKKRRAALEDERRSLQSGVYSFPREVTDLKAAIAGRIKLKTGAEDSVFIVAEVADIPEDRWRNVIEGYLHTQKFYLITPPEHFLEALHVYDLIKNKRGVYNTGLVDIEKIEQLAPRAESGSLAEEIRTENRWARLFLDYTLGRVMKCGKARDLRKFKTSVTDDGMLYQNYSARAINPSRWAKPAIGQDAILRRLENVKRELAALDDSLEALGTLLTAAAPLSALAIPGDTEAERLVDTASGMERIPELEGEILSLQKNLASVDRSAIEALRERIETLEAVIKQTNAGIETSTREQSRDETLLSSIETGTLPGLAAALAGIKAFITENYESGWIEAKGEPRYQKEFSERGGPAEIAEAFPRELSRSKNAKDKFWDELKETRRVYNERYKMGYDTSLTDNAEWDAARRELGENRLTEYRVKIDDARKKAYEQFREDFLSRLQDNINNAKKQIDDLNRTLSSSSFGEDRYRFIIIAKPEYKRYYDMIVDPMLLEGGYNLLSEQFNVKYHGEIADLFDIITGGADGRQSEGRDDYEKRVQTFTDYRTYLSFDLEVTNSEGESQRLSRTLGKKSGGETQTPFYIAVLASFTRLYRIDREQKASTLRLILFDEAFSKMDSERIISSIELLRKFKFQVVLSAPSDKIGDIAALTDKILLVYREKKDASVHCFDPRKEDLQEIRSLASS